MQPRDRALDDPAIDPQSAAVGGVLLGREWFDPHPAQGLPMRLRVIAPIPLHPLRSPPRSSAFATHGRNRFDQGQQLGDIIGVGTCQYGRQGNALRIRNEMVFAPRFGFVHGIRARFFPPSKARTGLLSTTARDQSIWSALRSWASSVSWMCCQTPAACQSRSRRQQVIPEPQPISWGRSSQGMPVFKTNRIPVRAWRWLIGLRPGCRNRLGLGAGNNGSIRFHNLSFRSGLAIGESSKAMRFTSLPNLTCSRPFC